MTQTISLLLGLIFGGGLLLSGMTDPARVLGFLDVAGAWDPSLAFVMGGAVIVAAPLFLIANKRAKPLVATEFEAPERTRIDIRLLGGSALFGIGWGLAGLCPGPALVVMGLDPRAAWPFVLSLAVGLALGRLASGAGGGRRPQAIGHDQPNAIAT